MYGVYPELVEWAGVWYIIIGLSLVGGLAMLLVVDLVEAVWAGRRHYPRGRR